MSFQLSGGQGPHSEREEMITVWICKLMDLSVVNFALGLDIVFAGLKDTTEWLPFALMTCRISSGAVQTLKSV